MGSVARTGHLGPQKSGAGVDSFQGETHHLVHQQQSCHTIPRTMLENQMPLMFLPPTCLSFWYSLGFCLKNCLFQENHLLKNPLKRQDFIGLTEEEKGIEEGDCMQLLHPRASNGSCRVSGGVHGQCPVIEIFKYEFSVPLRNFLPGV